MGVCLFLSFFLFCLSLGGTYGKASRQGEDEFRSERDGESGAWQPSTANRHLHQIYLNARLCPPNSLDPCIAPQLPSSSSRSSSSPSAVLYCQNQPTNQYMEKKRHSSTAVDEALSSPLSTPLSPWWGLWLHFKIFQNPVHKCLFYCNAFIIFQKIDI